MNLPIVPVTTTAIQFNQGFSPQIVERLNQHMMEKWLQIDNKFYKEFMKIVDNSSINDAKQIIHIYNCQLGKQVDFSYKSEYDILVELSTMVKSMTQPVEQLQALFHCKTDYLLPVGTHSWIVEDLDAILFFLNATSENLLKNMAFKGGREIIAAFENFIQFHVVDHGWNDGQFKCFPIEFMHPFNKKYFLYCFEQYKKWYLSHITPRKEFKWLEKCSDSQLDSLIDNLEKNNLRILKGTFHPVTMSDKISLIIASLNSVSPLEDRNEWVYPDINECHSFHREFSGCYTLSTPSQISYQDWVLANEAASYMHKKEQLHELTAIHREGLSAEVLTGIDTNLSIDLSRSYRTLVIPLKKIVHKGRNSYIKQFYEASRQKRRRDSQSVSEEERTIKILKKNMPILEKLAKNAGQSKDKFINDLIAKANTTD